MATFKVASGTKQSFYVNVKPKNPHLVKVKEIWLDRESGYTYFIYDETNNEDNLIDFSNNLFYNNNIGIEDNIFLNDMIDPI